MSEDKAEARVAIRLQARQAQARYRLCLRCMQMGPTSSLYCTASMPPITLFDRPCPYWQERS